MRADGEPGAVKRFAAEMRRAVVILFWKPRCEFCGMKLGIHG
jgi:hypothetical protein